MSGLRTKLFLNFRLWLKDALELFKGFKTISKLHISQLCVTYSSLMIAFWPVTATTGLSRDLGPKLGLGFVEPPGTGLEDGFVATNFSWILIWIFIGDSSHLGAASADLVTRSDGVESIKALLEEHSTGSSRVWVETGLQRFGFFSSLSELSSLGRFLGLIWWF